MDDFIVPTEQSTFSTSSLDTFFDKLKSGELANLAKSNVIHSEGDAFSIITRQTNSLYRTTAEENLIHNIWTSKSKDKAIKRLIQVKPIKYTKLDTDFIRSVACLSAENTDINYAQSFLEVYGIILIYVPYIKNSRIDGAAFKLPNGTPCIALSGRYKRVDNAWFTLLHELAHVILHYDSLDSIIIDDLKNLQENKMERQANNAAKFAIIPRDLHRHSETRFRPTVENLLKESASLGIAPQLLAGAICFEKQNYKLFSDERHISYLSESLYLGM